MNIKIFFYLNLIPLFYVAHVHATETTHEFLAHAKLQPHGFCQSGIKILDLQYDPTTQNAVLAYTHIYSDQGQGKLSPYIALYDPENIAVLQKIVFQGENFKNRRLGAAFSENGTFLTIGQQGSLAEQDLFIYKRLNKRFESLEKHIPKVLLELIQEYDNTPSYHLHKQFSHRTPWWQQLTLPVITVDRFAYNEKDDTVACYGDAVPRNLTLKDACRALCTLQRSVTIPPIGIIDLSAKQGSVSILSNPAHNRCVLTPILIAPGPQIHCTQSPNKRYIVYENADTSKKYLIDRLTPEDAREVSDRPEVLNNTGTLCIKQQVFRDDSSQTLKTCTIADNSVAHACTYPFQDSLWFGASNRTLMDNNYCFSNNMLLRHLENTSLRISASIAIPPASQDSSCDLCTTYRQHPRSLPEILQLERVPSLANLLNSAHISYISIPQPSAHFKQSASRLLALSTLIGIGTYLGKITLLSTLHGKLSKGLTGTLSLAAAYASYKIYQTSCSSESNLSAT